MNTASIVTVSTLAIMISNLNASLSTTMKRAPTNMFHAPFLLILSLELWTPCEVALWELFSDQTISFSDKAEPATTGRKAVSFPHVQKKFPLHASTHLLDYTEGAELVDSVLDVVRKEAEGTDCLQGG